MLLKKKTPIQHNGAQPVGQPLTSPSAFGAISTMDRREFLKRSGFTVGAGAAISQLPFNMIGKAKANDAPATGALEVKHSVCTHCSVGCSVKAVVQNGVWVQQEPGWESPISQGTHCAKGA